MKITKILYVVAISAGLFLSSCSMNKEVNNSAYLQSGKLQPKQQLVVRNSDTKQLAHMAAIPQANQPLINTYASVADNNTSQVNLPVNQGHAKKFARENFIKRTAEKFAQTITIPKAAAVIANLTTKPTNTASFKRIGHTTDMSYLWLWIICLVASILFYVLAAAFTLSYALGLAAIFYIFGVLASIAALVFFILWIVQLAKG